MVERIKVDMHLGELLQVRADVRIQTLSGTGSKGKPDGEPCKQSWHNLRGLGCLSVGDCRCSFSPDTRFRSPAPTSTKNDTNSNAESDDDSNTNAYPNPNADSNPNPNSNTNPDAIAPLRGR